MTADCDIVNVRRRKTDRDDYGRRARYKSFRRASPMFMDHNVWCPKSNAERSWIGPALFVRLCPSRSFCPHKHKMTCPSARSSLKVLLQNHAKSRWSSINALYTISSVLWWLYLSVGFSRSWQVISNFDGDRFEVIPSRFLTTPLSWSTSTSSLVKVSLVLTLHFLRTQVLKVLLRSWVPSPFLVNFAIGDSE